VPPNRLHGQRPQCMISSNRLRQHSNCKMQAGLVLVVGVTEWCCPQNMSPPNNRPAHPAHYHTRAPMHTHRSTKHQLFPFYSYFIFPFQGRLISFFSFSLSFYLGFTTSTASKDISQTHHSSKQTVVVVFSFLHTYTTQIQTHPLMLTSQKHYEHPKPEEPHESSHPMHLDFPTDATIPNCPSPTTYP